MKKFRILCITLTIVAILARLTGFLQEHISTPLIAFLLSAVLLSRGIDAYNQGKKEWRYWLAGAAIAGISLVGSLASNFSTMNQQKLIQAVLEAPNAEVAAAYDLVRQEMKSAEGDELPEGDGFSEGAELPEGAEPSKGDNFPQIASLEKQPSSPRLREVVSELFQGEASEELLDDCMSMNGLMTYQIKAVTYQYRMEVKSLKVKKEPQGEAYYYEAVLQPHGDNIAAAEIHVQGKLQIDAIALKIIGVKKIEAISIEGEELDAFFDTLETETGGDS